METEPKEICVQWEEFFYDSSYVIDGMSLDEFIEVIKSKFDFRDPDFKHKIIQTKGMRDGGDYHPDYEEVDNLEFITYRIETEEEARIRVEEYNSKEKERLEQEELKKEALSKWYKEQEKKIIKENLKQLYDKASEYYTKEEIESILKD